ncbi:MAG: oxidoreductase [Candidatus Competibacteraceae bacterium]|nr:oxidoreductase [Candidatus Competibacteraceae bacterium]MBK9950453.1 oxidoreductase [Candidatus Competibacteraceae bacterium]
MMRDIEVGLIGYGMAGRVFHAPFITTVPRLRLAKVVERRGETSRERYPWVETVKDVATLLADDRIELVVIATPSASHFELAQQALRAGKHVVVDKPFTLTSDHAQQLIDLGRQQNKLVSAFQNRRWDGDFQTVCQILRQGLLGRLVEYESHFDRFRNYFSAERAWREQAGPGGGVLFDLGAHLIDQALVLFGLPQRLTADIRSQRAADAADDQFELILHYDNLKVTLKSGLLAREPGPRFALHGTEGSFVKYGVDPQEDALKRGLAPQGADWGAEPEAHWGRLNTQIGGLHFQGKIETLNGNYARYYENIYQAITGQAALIVLPEQAKNTIRVIELARQSHAERRTVDVS